MQTQIDINSLLLQQSLDTSLLDPLRSRQIDQMHRGDRFDITARFRCLDVDDENAVGTGGFVIFWCLAHHSISITNK